MADIDIHVTNATNLANAINTANNDLDNAYTIIFDVNIGLTTDLPAIQAAVTIDGGVGRTLFGTNPVDIGAPSFRGFFVYSSGDPLGAGVVIQNLTISTAAANGGNGAPGGGGGAGMGGALFVNSGAVVTVIDVSIIDSVAVGGNGAVGDDGGGGGMGGDGWDGGA